MVFFFFLNNPVFKLNLPLFALKGWEELDAQELELTWATEADSILPFTILHGAGALLADLWAESGSGGRGGGPC